MEEMCTPAKLAERLDSLSKDQSEALDFHRAVFDCIQNEHPSDATAELRMERLKEVEKLEEKDMGFDLEIKDDGQIIYSHKDD